MLTLFFSFPRRTQPMRARRIYITLSIAAALLLLGTGAVLYLGVETSARFVPLMNRSLAMRLDVTMAHLWLADVLHDEDDVDDRIEIIWAYLNQADGHARAMLDGDKTGPIRNLPLQDSTVRREVTEIRGLLDELRLLTAAKLEQGPRPDPELNARYEGLFQRVSLRIERVDGILRERFQEASDQIQMIEILLVVGGMLLVGYMARTVHVYTSQLRHAIDALSTSEATMRSIFRAAPVGIGRVIDRVFMQVNDRLCQMLGYSAEELIGQGTRMVYPSREEYERVGRELYTETERRGLGTIEAKWQRRDGEIIDVMLNLTPFDPGNGSIGLTFTALDITQRKRMEETVRQQTAVHRALFTSMSEGCAYFQFALDEKGELTSCCFLEVNPAFERLFGLSGESLVGREVREIWPRVDAWWFARVGDVARNEHPSSFEGYHVPTGRYYHASIFKPIGHGDVFCIFYLDITDRMHSEQACERVNEELTRYSERLEEMVERRTAEIVEKNASLETMLHQLRTTQSQLVQSERMAFLGQMTAGLAHDINTPLGATNSAGMMIGSLFDRVVETAETLVDWRRGPHGPAVEQLLMAIREVDSLAPGLSTRQRSKARWELAAELRRRGVPEPEAAARFLIDIQLQNEYEPFLPFLQAENSPAIVRMLHDIANIHRSTDIIRVAVERAAKAVLAMKSYTRRDPSGRMEMIDLRENIGTVLTLFHNALRQGEVQVVTCLETPVVVECWPDEMSQVWTNLIQNALQAMDRQGRLTVAVKQIGPEAVVTIRDNGCGIPEAIRDRVFDPFFTTKPKGVGSGLGLDIVRRVVELHHGRIELQSEPGRGTTFRIFLPLRQPEGSTPLTPRRSDASAEAACDHPRVA